jgi:hypothetical protein
MSPAGGPLAIGLRLFGGWLLGVTPVGDEGAPGTPLPLGVGSNGVDHVHQGATEELS